ncbi:MAG TPA: SusC/RagA family TonB-linked outer membrane protein [Panacibacter sp.]|nr:SusC/RagA family TonB-linked outer membrane protein [Panacibacter sp.]
MIKLTCIIVVALLISIPASSQKGSFTGRIIEQNTGPVPFATVNIKGTKGRKITTVADAEGLFSIKALQGDTLLINAVNFHPFEMPLSSETNVSINLTRISNSLVPVVVTNPLGIKKEQRTATYSARIITANELNIIPQTNLNDALPGKIAGVQFRTQSGIKLNSQAFARVRGGLLLGGDAGPAFIVDGVYMGDAYDIDPSIVESITVLKGANATALMGGFINGAIVITTKQGNYNKSSVQVNQSVSVERVGLLPEFQNIYAGGGSAELLQYTWQQGHPDSWKSLDGKYFHDYTDDASWGPKMEGQEYVPWYAWVPGTKYSYKTAQLLPQPDNIRDFWQTGITSNTNISFSKAGQGYNAHLSYSKQYITGVLPLSKSDRNIVSGIVNLNINKFITTGIDFSYNTQNIHGNFNDGFINSTTGNFYQWNQRDLDMGIMKELRYLMTPAGTTATWNWAHNPTAYDPSNPKSFYDVNYWFNFYASQDKSMHVQKRDRLFGNAFIKANISSELSIKATVRIDHFTSYREIKNDPILRQSLGEYQTDQLYQSTINPELLVTYNKTVLHNVRLNVLAGYNGYQSVSKSLYVTTEGGLYLPDLYDFSNSIYQPYIGNGRYASKINALFAGGDIEYKQLVNISWTLRKSWYSTLPINNNSLFCPSAGISFIPTELVKNALPWLSFAKIYGSWSRSPLALGVYQTNTSFYVSPYQWNGNFLMTAGDVIPDENLKGGLINSYEAGLEIRTFKNRLGVNLNYYNETASDQPVQINVDAVSGITGKVINAASVKRQGLELTINAAAIKTKNFSWTITSTTGWLIDNKVTKIIEGQTRVQPYGWKSGLDRNSFASAYNVLGKDWGQLIGGGYTRNEVGIPLLDPSTGLYVAGDANYDYGPVAPKLTGGLQSFFTYKNLSFNFSIDYQHGGKFYSCSEYWGNYSGVLAPTATTNDRGANVRDPVANGGGIHVKGVSSVDSKTPVDMYVDAFTYFHQFRSTRIAEPYIHNLSYIKLRELSIGYNLPVKNWLFTKKYMQAATIALTARNPWLIYTAAKNFDPSEISLVYGEEGQMPPIKSFGISLTVTF